MAGARGAPDNTHDVDMLGATFLAGHRSEHVVTDVGVNASFGKGQAALPVDLDLNRFQPVDARQRIPVHAGRG